MPDNLQRSDATRRLPTMVKRACVTLVLALAVASCVSSQRRAERIGTAGAFIAVAGAATVIVGRQALDINADNARYATTTTGSLMQVTGILMVAFALDAVMRAEAHQNGFDWAGEAPNRATVRPVMPRLLRSNQSP